MAIKPHTPFILRLAAWETGCRQHLAGGLSRNVKSNWPNLLSITSRVPANENGARLINA